MELQGKLQTDWDQSLPRARWLCFLPMYHAMAQSIFGIMALKLEIPVYMMPKFDFVGMLENVQRFKITYLILVPPVVVAMAKSPLTRTYDLSSVEKVSSGAAPLGREIAAELEKLWPPGMVNVKQGWGMTELTCSAMGWHPDEHSDSFSVGNLNANCQAMLVDEDGKEVKQGERGEILIKAPNVMKGYWGRPEATAETLTADGWLKTGDIAYCDEKGRFYIVDRKKVCGKLMFALIRSNIFNRNSSRLKAIKLPPPSWKPCCSTTLLLLMWQLSASLCKHSVSVISILCC